MSVLDTNLNLLLVNIQEILVYMYNDVLAHILIFMHRGQETFLMQYQFVLEDGGIRIKSVKMANTHAKSNQTKDKLMCKKLVGN